MSVRHPSVHSQRVRSERPSITYEYTVDGGTYESSDVFPGPGENAADNATALVQDHPKGETVTAYYIPQNPREAFLVKERPLSIMVIESGDLTALAFARAIVK